MKVYVRTSINWFPETETEYTAWQGFMELGFQPVFYQKEEELSNCRPDELIVVRVKSERKRLNTCGIMIQK